MEKEKIVTKVLELLAERIKLSEKELSGINATIASETKSSAGDKFETSREMMNQEKNKILNHLSELNKQKTILSNLNPNIKKDYVTSGALVKTSKGTFFLSCSFGKVALENENIMLISTAAPLFHEMKGMKTKEKFEFRNRKYEILDVQ